MAKLQRRVVMDKLSSSECTISMSKSPLLWLDQVAHFEFLYLEH